MARGRYKIINGADVSGLRVDTTHGFLRAGIFDEGGRQALIGATSQALRVTPYNAAGVEIGRETSYRAATAAALVVAAEDKPFFIVEGSATKTVRVRRVVITGFTTADVEYETVQCKKTSAAASGGTGTALTQVPMDSAFAAGTLGLCKVYTAGPTQPTAVGVIASREFLAQDTTTAAAGILNQALDFDFRHMGGVVLRGVAEGLTFNMLAAPAAALTCCLDVEWTEE